MKLQSENDDKYGQIPSTGAHRGGRLEVAVTTSVRAQEPVDPGRIRRPPPQKPASPADAPAKNKDR